MTQNDDSMFGNTKPGKNKTGGTSLKSGKPVGARQGSPLYEKWVKDTRIAQLTASRATMKGPKTIREISETDELFQECCSITGVNPFRRQCSKWLNSKGASRTQLRKAMVATRDDAQLSLNVAEQNLKEANKAASKFNGQDFFENLKLEKDDDTLAVEQIDAEFEGTLAEYKAHLYEMEALRLDGEVEKAKAAEYTAKKRMEIKQDFYNKLIKQAV